MCSIRPVNKELAEKARLELNELTSRIPEDLETLRKWIAKQPHLNARTDDQFLVSFLRGCKYSLERTKEKLDSYYTVKSLIPDFFEDRDPNNPMLQEIMSLGFAILGRYVFIMYLFHSVNLPLPYTIEPDSPILMLNRIGCYDANKYTVLDIMKVCFMMTDIQIHKCDSSIVAGHIILVDLRGISISLISQMTPTTLKKMATVIEGFPIRTKAIHFINPSTGFDTLFRLFRGFLSVKIQNRLFIHDTFEDLHKDVPKKFLPKEYGGTIGSIESIISYWKQKMIENRQFYLEDVQYKTNERKRIGEPKSAMDLFGVDGSFRKLEVD